MGELQRDTRELFGVIDILCLECGDASVGIDMSKLVTRTLSECTAFVCQF